MSAFLGWTGAAGCGPRTTMLAGRLAAASPQLQHPQLSVSDRGLIAASGRQLAFAVADDWTVALVGRACRLAGHPGPVDHDALLTHWLPELRRRGPAALDRLQGGFSVIALEQRSGHLLLAIDRIGICPLAFARTGEGLAFASSADLLRRHPDVDPALRDQALYDYLYFHMVPSPGTVYRAIDKLQPSELLTYADGRIERGIYWNPRFTDEGRSSDNSAGLAEELRSRLATAVTRCGMDTATGAFLSGGLDSSTVVAMAAATTTGSVRTYSIGFDAEGYDEIAFARIAASRFGARAREYYVTPDDVVDAVPRITAAYDEPFGNSSAVPAYFCARIAREEGMHTLLAGDGGDELFAGNARYATQQLFEHYFLLPPFLRRSVIEPSSRLIPLDPRIPLLTKIRRYIDDARVPLPARMERYNYLQRTAPSAIFDADFLGRIDTAAPLRLLQEVYRRADSDSALNRMLYLDWKQTLADNDLRKVNGMCELAGIHVVYPMLDDDLVELSMRIPVRLKIWNGRLRHFYKEALKDVLPREIIDKKKHGFGLPFGVWMRTDETLKSLAHDSLSSFSRRGIVRPGLIDEMMTRHRDAHASYYGEMIWVLMMLELWLSSHDVPAVRA